MMLLDNLASCCQATGLGRMQETTEDRKPLELDLTTVFHAHHAVWIAKQPWEFVTHQNDLDEDVDQDEFNEDAWHVI